MWPRGEITWALLRGACYSAVFIVVMLVMGLVSSWWMLLALPTTLLIGYAFAGAGMALTTWMRSWQDFEFVQLAIMPMFLFSAHVLPDLDLPGGGCSGSSAAHLCTKGSRSLRAMALGTLGWTSLVSVAYLLTMGTVGLVVAGRRVGTLLLK